MKLTFWEYVLIIFGVVSMMMVGAVIGEVLTKDRHYQDGYSAHEIEVCMAYGWTQEECE